MMGIAPVPPRAPMLVMVKVPPRRSSSVALPSRTRWARAASSPRDLEHGLAIDVAQHRHDEAALGGDRHAEVVVALENQLARAGVEARVEVGMAPQREGHRLEQERGRG